jgi:hypothetical protein
MCVQIILENVVIYPYTSIQSRLLMLLRRNLSLPLPTSSRISIICMCRQAYLALEGHEYDTWVRLHHLPRTQGKAVSNKVYGYKDTMVVLDKEPKSSIQTRWIKEWNKNKEKDDEYKWKESKQKFNSKQFVVNSFKKISVVKNSKKSLGIYQSIPICTQKINLVCAVLKSPYRDDINISKCNGSLRTEWWWA